MEAEDEEKRKLNRACEAHIYLEDGDVWPVTASQFVICAGPQSGHIAYLAGIGSGEKKVEKDPTKNNSRL